MSQSPRAAVAMTSGCRRGAAAAGDAEGGDGGAQVPVMGSRTVRSMRNACAAWGNPRSWGAGSTWRVRVSSRPCPRSCIAWVTACLPVQRVERGEQGRLVVLDGGEQVIGSLVFHQVPAVSFCTCRASAVTSAPVISTSSSSGLTWVISLVFWSTSFWASTARAPQIIAASRCGALPSLVLAPRTVLPSSATITAAASASPAITWAVSNTRTRWRPPRRPVSAAPAGTWTATAGHAAPPVRPRAQRRQDLRGNVGGPLADRGHRISSGQHRRHHERQHRRHAVPDPAPAPRLGHCLQAFQQAPVTMQVSAVTEGGHGTGGQGRCGILARQRGSRGRNGILRKIRSYRDLVARSGTTHPLSPHRYQRDTPVSAVSASENGGSPGMIGAWDLADGDIVVEPFLSHKHDAVRGVAIAELEGRVVMVAVRLRWARACLGHRESDAA